MTGAKVDVAVIGGGLTGVSAAYHLAALGASVALVDRERIGHAAAPRPGFVLTGISDHLNRLARGVGIDEALEILRFSVANRARIRELVLEHGIECGYDGRGAFAVATSPAEAADLEESMALLAGREVDGLGARLLDAAALRDFSGAPCGLAAIRYDDDASLDLDMFLRALMAALPRERVRVEEGAALRALEIGGAEVRIETGRGEIRAELVILAAGARTREAHPFVEGLVWPVRGQGFVTRPVPPRRLAGAVSATWGHELYRQLEDGRYVALGFRPDPAPEDVTFDEGTTDLFRRFVGRFAAERLPGFSERLDHERRFSVIAAYTQDALPLVGALPGSPRVLVGCGYNMREASFGMACGRALARLASDGVREHPASFLPARFL